MRQLRFTDDASDNLVDIALYIASQSQSREVALTFVDSGRESQFDQVVDRPAELLIEEVQVYS